MIVQVMPAAVGIAEARCSLSAAPGAATAAYAPGLSTQVVGGNKLRVVLTQGINRQIRRMFAALGYKVKRLTRTRLGPLRLGRLPRGSWREFTAREIDSLRKAAAGR